MKNIQKVRRCHGKPSGSKLRTPNKENPTWKCIKSCGSELPSSLSEATIQRKTIRIGAFLLKTTKTKKPKTANEQNKQTETKPNQTTEKPPGALIDVSSEDIVLPMCCTRCFGPIAKNLRGTKVCGRMYSHNDGHFR